MIRSGRDRLIDNSASSAARRGAWAWVPLGIVSFELSYHSFQQQQILLTRFCSLSVDSLNRKPVDRFGDDNFRVRP
jgi:hypothetical protein